MDGFFGLDRHFAAVFCRIEPESVREALAIGEVVRVEVDAPLALDGLGFLEEVVDVADGGITPVEGTADIDGIVGCSAGGKDGLDEDLVVLGRKSGLLVVEQEALLLDAAEGCKGGEADQYGFQKDYCSETYAGFWTRPGLTDRTACGSGNHSYLRSRLAGRL